MTDDREKLIDAMIDAVWERSGNTCLLSYAHMDLALFVAERALAEKHARIADGHRAYNDSHYDRIRNGVCDEISAKIRASIGGGNE